MKRLKRLVDKSSVDSTICLCFFTFLIMLYSFFFLLPLLGKGGEKKKTNMGGGIKIKDDSKKKLE